MYSWSWVRDMVGAGCKRKSLLVSTIVHVWSCVLGYWIGGAFAYFRVLCGSRSIFALGNDLILTCEALIQILEVDSLG